MVWLNRTPIEFLSDIDRMAAAAVNRVAQVARPELGLDGPRANFKLGQDEATLELQVPGFGPEHVQVTVERDHVAIRGERKEGEGDDAKVVASFARRFRLPYEIDADRVAAKLEHGLLRLTLPKVGQGVARTITIQ